MNIKTIEVGSLKTNCYILENDVEALIIDPGDDPLKIDKELDKKLVGIIITHHHDDHTGGVFYFKDKYNVPIYDFYNLPEGINNIGKFMFEVIYTKGHTKDSISIYFKKEKKMFVGDFVFYHTIGRTDLDGGNYSEMKNSINKLKEYDDIDIYPGHGVITNLEEEKKNNIYFG